MGLYAVGTWPSATNLPASKQIYNSAANAFVLGLSSSLAGSNLPASPSIRYGAFNQPAGSDTADQFLSAIPVIIGGQPGMVAHQLVSNKPNGGQPGWPYGNGGRGT
jgi:hypothetical protein